ncbi:MAG: hypothetical protein ACK4V4_11080 [Sphingobacteriales bacterium]|jgi:ammonia channel protein AmtB
MKKGSPQRPILLLFLLIIAVFIIFKPWLHSIGFDVHMLTIGNGIIFLMTFLSSKLLLGSMKAANSASFLRGVYGSFLIKFLIVAIAVLVYAFIKRSNVNKIGIFTLMGIYLVYTYIEISSLLKQTKKDV